MGDVTMKTWRPVILFIVAMGVVSLFMMQAAFAEASVVAENTQTVNPKAGTPCARSVPGSAAVSQSFSSLDRPPRNPIEGFIGGFFALGCKTNYCLTRWILSDKCETDTGECDEAQCAIPER